jgi:succinylglutamate desuccinylase
MTDINIQQQSVYIKEGVKPGKTLAVFCGVHGNETAGILAVKKVLNEIKIDAGKVYFVFANPKAIEQGVRFTKKNLNRCFLKNQSGDTYEEKRARELMPILDECDALLDLHASNIPNSTPFIIFEEPARGCVEMLDFPIISTGWDALEPGATDGYMFQQGKPAICAECGYAARGEEYASLAENTIYNFLQFYGAIKGDATLKRVGKQKYLHVDEVIIKEKDSFVFTKMYEDFETLPAGHCFATDSEGKEYVVEKERVIVFANPNKEMGGEACILGEWK